MSIRDLVRSKIVDSGKDQFSSDIITFATASWGLGVRLFPAQIVVLKCFHGLPLNKTRKTVEVTKAFEPDVIHEFTEYEFVQYLIDNGQCNLEYPDEFLDTYELLLVVGRRGGKTTVAAVVASDELRRILHIRCPQTYFQMASPYEDIDVINVATGEKQAGVLFNREVAFAQRCNFFKPFRLRPTKKEMRFRTQFELDTIGKGAQGSIILSSKPCSARGIRGYNSICVLLDEQAHFMDVAGSDRSDYAVYDALTPSIGGFIGPSGKVEGRVVSMTSPLGKSGLTYDSFIQGFKSETRKDRLVFQMPTWLFNPRIDRKFLRSEFNKKGKVVFDMEYGGIFGDATHPWMPRELFESVAVKEFKDIKRERGVFYYVGIDIGAINDGVAVSITYPNKETQIIEHAFSEVRYAGLPPYENMSEISFEAIVDWLVELNRIFPFKGGVLDQWSGVALQQLLKKQGLHMIELWHMTRSLNSLIYRNMETLIRDKRVNILKMPELIDEICSLECTMFSKYEYKVEAPNREGSHDDLSDSLARSIYLSTQSLTQNKTNVSLLTGTNQGVVSSKRAYSQYLRRTRSLAKAGIYIRKGNR